MMTQRTKDLKEYIKAQVIKRRHSKDKLFQVAGASLDDVMSSLGEVGLNPKPLQLLTFIRILTTSGIWVSHSYLRFLASLVDFSVDSPKHDEPKTKQILDSVAKNETLPPGFASPSDIFKTIYNELEFKHHNPHYESKLKVPSVKPTIVLVSGVFNEIFTMAFFERGALHLQKNAGIKYITANVSGTKSCGHNAKLLKNQLNKYMKDNPNEKLWIIAFSKGGVDALHFLKDNRDFTETNIVGFSSIATPILGTNHTNHRVLTTLNKLYKKTTNKFYKKLDIEFDLFASEIQKSLAKNIQKHWFEKNHKDLPRSCFYTAMALEAEWYESHLWMMLAKLFFRSKNINDGIVDADQALFPNYFDGINLGIVKGHHLIGTRSSHYSQEALLEAHIIFLKYMNLVE